MTKFQPYTNRPKTMKNLIIYLTLLLPLLTRAQTDTIKVSYSEEKVPVFEKTTLLDEYEKAFGGNRVVKSALRVNFEKNLYGNEPEFKPYNSYFEKPLPQIQYEQKIGLDRSLILGIQWGRAPFLANLNVDIEGRWYYRMKRRINAGIQQANITGKYLSLRIESKPFWNSDTRKFRYMNDYESIFKAYSSISLNWGMQFGNFLNYGFALGLKQGDEIRTRLSRPRDKRINTWFFTSRTPISLGLYFPKKRKVKNNYCEFLQCNYEVKQLFKLDLTNAFYFDKYLQTVVIDLGYERKLGYSPFSLNTSIIGGLTNNHIEPSWEIDSAGYSIPGTIKKYYSATSYELKQQLRYYLGMQKKIVKGVSAGNLNGVYLGLFGSYGGSDSNNWKKSDIYVNFRTEYLRWGAMVGYQVQTNRYSFLDIGASFHLQNFDYVYNDYSFNERVSQSIEIKLKLGIAR